MTRLLPVQVSKELRALLPWWAGVALTIVAIGQMAHVVRLSSERDTDSFLVMTLLVYIAGAVTLGALSIGHEYGYRALPMLLAQPVSRARVLATKLGVLAVLLGALAAIVTWQFWADETSWRLPWVMGTILALPAVVGLLLTPWLTIVSRGPLAGAVFSIALPLVVYVVSIQMHLRDQEAMVFAVRITLALVAIGGALTWRSFLRLEAIDGPHAEIGVPAWVRRRVRADEWSSQRSSRVRNPIWLLLRKELHLQHMTLVVSAAYVTLWFGVMIARGAMPGVVGFSLDVGTGLYTIVVALMAGALASAEERHLGTAAWQTLMPMPDWKQWTLKAGTALSLTLVLGFGLPAVLDAIPTSVETLPFDDEWLLFVVMLCIAALYVSSLSTSGMRAFLTSLPVIAVAGLAGSLALGLVALGADDALGPIARRMTPFYDFRTRTARMLVFFLVLLPIIAGFCLMLLRFAGKNHHSADRNLHRIRQQIISLFAYATGGAVVFGFVSQLLDASMRPFPK